MTWFSYLFELFTGLFGFATSNFTNLIGLITVTGLIGGLSVLFKWLVYEGRGEHE